MCILRHSGLFSRDSILMNNAPSNWILFMMIIKIGFDEFVLGDGIEFPPQWSQIEHLFDSKEGLYPLNDMEVAVARTALYGQSYHGDVLTLENAPVPSDAAIKGVGFRWPGYPGNATIPYVIDSSLSMWADLIAMAMAQYHAQTCVRFVSRTNEKDYIRLFYGRGCTSYIGRIGGAQDVNLGEGCGYVGTIVHELGHAVGLYHEHQRTDRDQYINVYINNVESGYESNFDITPAEVELILTNFDLYSIMIYGEYAFSKSADLKTMEAKNQSVILKDPYAKPGLDNTDILQVNKLYECQ